MENRNGMVVDITLTQSTSMAERESALDMIKGAHGSRCVALGADKGYDTKDFVTMCRQMNVTPHVARPKTSKLDGCTTRHIGYQTSQQKHKRVEEIFSWVKTVGGGQN